MFLTSIFRSILILLSGRILTAGLRTEGRYLMSKFSSSGVKKNNELISSCTAESVAATLANLVSSFFYSVKF